MRILITGAEGFVGKRLVRLLEGRHTVLKTTLDKANSNDDTFYLDLCDAQSIDQAVKEAQPDFIVHCAAAKSQGQAEADPQQAFRVNYQGTAFLAEAAMKYAVPKMLVLSSVKATYPVSAYGMSKAMMEKQLMAYNLKKNVPTRFLILRLGNILNSPGTFLKVWARMTKENGLIESTGKGLHGFFITTKQLDNYLTRLIEEELNAGLYVPLMKSAGMIDFLNAWKKHFGTAFKFIEARNFDLPHEFLINKTEINKTLKIELQGCKTPFLFSGEEAPEDYEIVRKEWSTENSSKFTAEELESVFANIKIDKSIA